MNKLLTGFACNIPKNIRHTFLIELIAGFFIAVGAGCFGPYFALIAQDNFDAGQFLIGLMSAGGTIGSLGCLLTSGLVPPGKEKITYVISCTAARVLIIAMALSHSAGVYCAFGFFFSLFTCLPGPQYNMMMQRLYPIEYRGRLMGLARLNVSVVICLTTFISGRCMHGPESWRYVFFVGGAAYIIGSLLYLLWRVPEPETDMPKVSVISAVSSAMRLMKEEKIHLYLVLILIIAALAANILVVVLPIYQVEHLNINPARLSIISTCGSVAAMVGYVFWGRFIDKRESASAYALQALIGMVLPISYFFAQNWVWVLPAGLLSGFAASGAELAWITMLMEMSRPGQEIRVQTLHSFWSGVRGLLGILAGVYLISLLDKLNIEMRYVFLIALLLQLIGAAGLVMLARKYSRKDKNRKE